ncbi:hypothetical protein FGO68_gene12303 [Halteria grandinella]|uniref:Tetratricopeptide repeat protein n=1 Tax=Halteria grandinella TaxID=5974 RepID=A0A8J8NHS9_HALGN|nr:hypothetical protein FGO68_gene12303 [Halteria grandinella]
MAVKQKTYTAGVMFGAQIIDDKIKSIKDKFFSIFIFLFLRPYVITVLIIFALEVVFIVRFTSNIFKTINDLHEKIDLLRKNYKKFNKSKSIADHNQASHHTRNKTYDGESFDYLLMRARRDSQTSLMKQDESNNEATVDVMQDYQGRESCMEITKLYRAANKLIKTLLLARTSSKQGDENKALLCYNEVANLFLDKSHNHNEKYERSTSKLRKGGFDLLLDASVDLEAIRPKSEELFSDGMLNENLAICFNNIACIYARQENFTKANHYFIESIRIEENIAMLNTNPHKSINSAENMRFALRYFNFGYSLYKQFKKFSNKRALCNISCAQFIIPIVFDSNILKTAKDAKEFLRKSKKCFKALKYKDQSNGVHNQRSFQDVCIFIRLLKQELSILTSHQFYKSQVDKSLAKLHSDIFHYIKSEDYQGEEHGGLTKYWLGRVREKQKGLWYFSKDTLLQYLLYITGLYFEKQQQDAAGYFSEQKALHYYEQSFTNPLISRVEHQFMHLAMQRIDKLIRHRREMQTYLGRIRQLEEKYKRKKRSIQVIMELSNENQYSQEVILSFVRDGIFDKLLPKDLFGLIQLRSGRNPHQVIKLEQKHLNTKIKQRILNELNYTQRMEEKVGVSFDLGRGIQKCYSEARCAGFNEPCENWIVAIVGQQQQELSPIQGYLMRRRKDPQQQQQNLIILGVGIQSGFQCRKYRRLCHLTEQGQFVNLDFEDNLFIDNNLEDYQPSYIRALNRVEATMALFDSKCEPFITENIDFT